MANRLKPGKRKTPMGPRGPRGKTGPRGPKGSASSEDHVAVLELSAQMKEVLKELQVQLTRIAQIQAQLDRLASGQPATQVERRAIDRSRH